MASRARRVGVCERLLHEGDALREAARQGIRVTKMRGRDVKERVHLGPAQLDGALQRWNGLGDGAPAEGDEAQAPMGVDEVCGIIDLAGEAERLFDVRYRFRELAQFGEAPGDPPPRAD